MQVVGGQVGDRVGVWERKAWAGVVRVKELDGAVTRCCVWCLALARESGTLGRNGRHDETSRLRKHIAPNTYSTPRTQIPVYTSYSTHAQAGRDYPSTMSVALPYRDINVHSSPSHYAFSSPSSPSAPTLVVDRPSGDIRLHDGKLLGSKRVSSIAGILGMIKLRLGMPLLHSTRGHEC